jgi:hypothetical protein
LWHFLNIRWTDTWLLLKPIWCFNFHDLVISFDWKYSTKDDELRLICLGYEQYTIFHTTCCAGMRWTAFLHNRLICCHNIDCIYTDKHVKNHSVVLAKHRTAPWWWFLRESKHVRASIIIFYIVLTFLWFYLFIYLIVHPFHHVWHWTRQLQDVIYNTIHTIKYNIINTVQSIKQFKICIYYYL